MKMEKLQHEIDRVSRREAALIEEWNNLVKAVNQVDKAIASPMYTGKDVEDAFYHLVDAMKQCKALFEEPSDNRFYDLLQMAHANIHEQASQFFSEQNVRWKLEREIDTLQEIVDSKQSNSP